MDSLPIDPALPALREALRTAGAAVLQAPPGSGKTTRVPPALLEEPWLAGRRIVLLEPRRLAARAAARFMARSLGERVGETVGYRMRRDTRIGRSTRLEVVTEGVLTRMLQADPGLEGIGLVVFDEFHERSLHADLGLALTLHSRRILRDDLRVLVMSATLDGAAVAALLGGAPVVTAAGRRFPVTTRYLDPRDGARLEDTVAGAVRLALAEEPGDVLVFLPGTAEIRRVAGRLDGGGLGPGVTVAPLYADLPADAQDSAIRPSPPGRRKVVLATSIAQTSLTIEGVRVVIDAGLARVPRFSPRSGMTRLATVRVSLAAAEQRRGRAGRVAPGVCYRLWPASLDRTLRPHDLPEMLDADLAPLALELAEAGIVAASDLRWLDPPPAAALAQARELLAELGALDGAGGITAHGRRMAGLGVHPRLAHLLLRGRELGLGAVACDIAAVLGDRDPLRASAGADADLRTRLDALRRGDGRIAAGVRGRLREEARRLREAIGAGSPREPADEEWAGLLLALAYPDRVGQRRPGAAQRFVLRNGQGAYLAEPQALGESPYLTVAELDGDPRESRVFLAAPVSLEDLLEQFGDQVRVETAITWDEGASGVIARRREQLGALVLRDAPLRDPDPAAVRGALVAWLRREGPRSLPWSDAARRLRERLRFLHRLDAGWPDVSDEVLMERLEEWLGPELAGVRRRDQLARVDLAAALPRLLDPRQRRTLDELAPTQVEVPSGSRIAIDYSDADAPVLPVRLQEVFGWRETPRIAGGRVPLTLHLLSPAQRPVQVTRDLAGFWRTTYFEVRKDLRGRYPKHHWPDDPLAARATRRAKRRDV
ncbi:MAG TPA: ATP-dependent helicase HrpB [Gemmatimonadales bacterium]|nr:ATP-dependent helicase HrpB [Gemmatimonadales bacterium]